jgi:hypothetical protein
VLLLLGIYDADIPFSKLSFSKNMFSSTSMLGFRNKGKKYNEPALCSNEIQA